MATLAKNRNVKLRYDEAIVETLNKKIELNFKQVTIEELLSATLEGSGLSYQLTETELIIKR